MLKKILAWVLACIGAAWLVLTQFSAAITLWPDLHDFWSKHMSGDPWMPWTLLTFGLAVLAWTYFPAYRFLFVRDKPMTDEKKGINQSVNIGTMTGGSVSPIYNNHFNTVVSPGRVVLSELGISQLAELLAGYRVRARIVGDLKCLEIGERAVEELRRRGIQIDDVDTCYQYFPLPSQPYAVQLKGEVADLIISPATLP